MLRAHVLAIATIAAAITAAPASAATLTVTTTADETTAGDHACSLREAIAAVDSPGSANGDCAPAAFGANTIVLGASTYTLGNSFPGQHDELLLGANSNVTITGAGEGKTTIDATNLGNRVLEIPGGASLTIGDLTITGGHAPDGAAGAPGGGNNGGDGQPGGNGGAILNNGTLTMNDSAVTNSRAGAGGAGGTAVAIMQPIPASHGGAGGLGGSGGAIFSAGTLKLTGVTLAGDQAGGGGAGGTGGTGNSPGNAGGAGGAGGPGGSGGGVANGGGTLVIVGSTIRGNTSGAGGAGGVGGSGPGAAPSAGGVGADGGTGGSGAGVWSDHGPLTLSNGTIVSNTTGDGGAGGAGGVGVTTGGAGGAGGAAGSGGAVVVSSSVGSTALNATLAGNRVGQPGQGGAGGNAATVGAAGVAGSAGTAGGVMGAGGSVIAVRNSLLALNTAGNCGTGVSDGGNNLSFGGTGCPAGFASGDPNLGPLQDNGGPTQTISLGSGSAAIDKIPPTGAGCPATDQRGVKRPAGSECDIGAYEFAPPKISTVTVTDVGNTNATVNALVTPNAGTAQVEIDYGRTKAYGSKSVTTAAGVAAIPVSTKLLRLRAKTTYHFRIVVSAIDGTVTTTDRTFATSPAPVLSKLKIKPSAFRAGGRGMTITYTDSLAASVTFVALRRTPGSKRFVMVGSFTHKDKAGPNSVRFNGRLRSGTLARGSYRLELIGRANGRSSRTLATTFRIAS